ncbi:MAG: orotidine-5'-phosphate decarboxylase [Coxiella sp. (in: Bacteria)]|nr:MAG: orotidine-5'-phosphate decarboxylase [Coxiella sp. (in: g-proteobacteria)]
MTTPIIVALDFETKEEALFLAKKLDPQLCRLKVASTLFTRYGPDLIEALRLLGFDIFLDLKYHDIPKQVAVACKQAAQLGVWMLTLHASGGEAMMTAARDAVEGVPGTRPLLVGVTVLTSLSDADLIQIGYKDNVVDSVLNLAKLAKASGLDGVVSSAAEASALRHALGDDFVLVTPGIRLPGNSSDDQKRVVTPEAALAAGSNYLVIGRAITQAPEPVVVLQQILNM